MKFTVKGKEIVLPDFLIVGASRSGTSSLYFYLREHPQIFMPEDKEPHFFNGFEYFTLEEYADLFSSAAEGQLLGEATATYLYYYRDTVESIKQIYGFMYTDLRIIAILRNPIERAWSWYLLEKQHGIDKSFFEAVRQFQKGNGLDYHDFIKSGMYVEQITLFRNTFPHTKFFLFEEFTEQPVNVLKEIYQFLGLEHCTYIPSNLDMAYNASGDPKRGIYKPLYNFLFHENRLKRIAKSFIPFKLRQIAINTLANRILKKPEIPPDVRDYLMNTYKQEIISLASLFPDERQADLILGWAGD